MLLADHPCDQQGLPLRSDGQADADGCCCRPTCREFGGKDLLKRPASHFVGQKHPGGLFALDVGVKGPTLPAFKG